MSVLLQTVNGGKYAGIYVALQQCCLYLVRLHLLHPDVQCRVFFHQLRKEARKQIRGDGRQDAQTKCALHGLLLLQNNVLDAFCLLQHFACTEYDLLSNGCGADGLTVAVEQFCTHFLFQFAYHGTERGLSNIASIGSSSEVSVSGNSQDIFKLLQGHNKVCIYNKVYVLLVLRVVLGQFYISISLCSNSFLGYRAMAWMRLL